jgi:hypothetical protein
MATETTPLNPATEAYASKSAAELQQEKKNLIDGDLNSKLKQGKDVEKGEGGEEEELPNGPLDKCCAPFRENCLFTQCVAREKETPLNILHIFQPTCVVLLAIGLALTSSAAFPPETFRFIVLIFNAAASGCLLTVGLVARKIPSQEKLNVQLNKQISKMGKDVNAFEGHGDTADNLANMTLGWVDQNRKTRDRMKLLNKMLQQSQARARSRLHSLVAIARRHRADCRHPARSRTFRIRPVLMRASRVFSPPGGVLQLPLQVQAAHAARVRRAGTLPRRGVDIEKGDGERDDEGVQPQVRRHPARRVDGRGRALDGALLTAPPSLPRERVARAHAMAGARWLLPACGRVARCFQPSTRSNPQCIKPARGANHRATLTTSLSA